MNDVIISTSVLRTKAVVLTLAMFFALVSCGLAWSQENANVEDVPADLSLDSDEGVFLSPVTIEGDTVFYVRGSTSFPGHVRSERIAERVYEIAEREGTFSFTPEIVETDFGLEIRIDGTPVTLVTAVDAEIDQMDLSLAAQLRANALEQAILKYKNSRTDDAYVDSAFTALALTVAFITFTVLFIWKRKNLAAKIASFAEKRASGLGEAAQSVVKAQAIGSATAYLVNVLFWLVFVVALYTYISFVLLEFPETRVPGQIVLTYVSEPLALVVFAFVSNIPNFIMLFVIFLVTRAAIKGLRLFLDNLEAGTIVIERFEAHWVKPTFFLGRIAILLIALVCAYPFIPGSDTAAFKGLTIIAGVVVSFSSNTVIANFISGIIVMYRRSAVIGDRIQVDETIGDVVEIRFMETIIKSIKNELISIPNSHLLNSTVRNYSKKVDGRGLLVHTTVGIGYEEPPQKVIAMLKKAADITDGLKKTPKPFVLWTALGDFSISYEINAYTTRGTDLPKIMSDLHENIVAVFNANGTQIMTPSYMADPSDPKIAPDSWDGKITDPNVVPAKA